LQAAFGLRDNKIIILQKKIAQEVKSRDEEVLRIKKELQSQEAIITELKMKLNRAESETATALSEFGDLQTKFEREKSKLELRIETLETSLAESQRIADLHEFTVARFMDPVTGVQRRCPLIQSNGVIQSLGAVIEAWVQEPDMGAHALRMFKCSVTKSFSMISPFPILDAFMKLARSAGVDTTSPIVFFYQDVGGAWVEFSFHEQLELIARLCSVYRDRENAKRHPEQWTVSLNVGGSASVLMRAVAKGGGFRLECFGMKNDGPGRVDIKTVFDPSWVHPFGGMEFPSDD
jgi:hypothetical protein